MKTIAVVLVLSIIAIIIKVNYRSLRLRLLRKSVKAKLGDRSLHVGKSFGRNPDPDIRRMLSRLTSDLGQLDIFFHDIYHGPFHKSNIRKFKKLVAQNGRDLDLIIEIEITSEKCFLSFMTLVNGRIKSDQIELLCNGKADQLLREMEMKVLDHIRSFLSGKG